MLVTVQLPAHACGNRFSGEPDAGKSACPVRRGESGSHRKVSPSLLLYRLGEKHAFLLTFRGGRLFRLYGHTSRFSAKPHSSSTHCCCRRNPAASAMVSTCSR